MTGLWFCVYSYVLGLDIDEDALEICNSNVEEFEATCIDLLLLDALKVPKSLHKSFDIAVMNPPFGTKHNKGERKNSFCFISMQ